MEEAVDFETKLIDCVREFKVLYDKTLDGYRDKNAKGRAWSEIGKKLLHSADHCQKMWNNLRSQYLAHRRKLKKPTGSAAGTRPHYRHELSMQFLNDANDVGRTYSNVADDENKEEQQSQLESSDGTDAESPSPAVEENSEGSSTSFRNTPDHRSHSKPKSKRKLDAVDEEMLKILKTDDDEYTVFGNLVATKLRAIGEVDRKLFLETEHFINTMLYEAAEKILE